MSILSDTQIVDRMEKSGPFSLQIDPFTNSVNTAGTISYGLSSYGYDVRLGTKFKVFTNALCGIIDPKAFDTNAFEPVVGNECLIPPNSFALAESLETVKIPRDVLVLCLGKSTYARCGIIVNVTPLEPEWHGKITIEISNTAPLPAKVYAGEGIMQLVFLKAEHQCATSYKDKKGKYQGQKGITLPKVT